MTLLAALAVALTLEQQIHALEKSGAICSAGAVKTFYARRNFAPAWNDTHAAALLRAIEHADDDGLSPDEYIRPWNEGRDVLLTDAFLTYATHLARGRVDPETLDRVWCIEPRQIDLPAVLEAALADGAIERVLPTLAPRHEPYRRLRRAYHVYRAMSDWTPIERGQSMRLGDRGPRVQRLRARLGIAGGDLFDDATDAEVRDVQRHHGLSDDGIVGPKTLEQLNVPRIERVRQIAANLERWRWMPADLGPRHLLVNIAAFQLDLVDGERTSLSMKIVAGKQYTATPFFAANVERVIVNPPWNVPDKIAYEELWPKQRRDPGYFAREHMRVVEGGRIRQDPGPWCALGRIKFDLPNRFNVYLHDTPAKSLFGVDLRAFSHGCIRLEKPIDLAIALTGRTREEIETLIAREREVTIPLATPVPVYVLYWTAFVADDGHVEFRRDVYGRDPRLVAHVTETR